MHSREKIEIPTAFPRWSHTRIIAEAARDWNLRHPENLCDPAKSDWGFICAVVHSWLRHSFSRYDEALRDGHNREILQAAAHKAASRFYPWLRIERDPRSADPKLQNSQSERPFDRFSRSLIEHSSRRSAALSALRSARRKGDKTQVAALEKEIAKSDQKIRSIWELVKPDCNGERNLIMRHKSGDYDWVGISLQQNHIETLPFTCGECGARFCRSKRRIDVGAGISCFIVTCHCSTFLDQHKDGFRAAL
jgi:hypothetical protein